MLLPPFVRVPSPNFNSRGGCRIDQIIIHDEEGSFAASDEWFEQRASHVSAHLTVSADGSLVHLLVDFENRAWHACDFNSRSIGIEMAGFSRNGFSDAQRLTTARICAHLCHRFGIPIRHAKGGVGPGIESHWGLGAAGGGHRDPSTDPQWMEDFVALVKAEFDAGRYPIVWEEAAPQKPSADIATTSGLQAALAALHFEIDVDGQLGSQTEGVIQSFQIIAGLKPTAAADDATRAAILKALSGG